MSLGIRKGGGVSQNTRAHSVAHIYGLDVLRFVAAGFVVVYHFGRFDDYTGSPAFPFLDAWTRNGWIGVQFFFVLSGLVIARTALRSSALAFGLKRAIRILPALWICATISLVVVAVTTRDWPTYFPDWLRTITLFPKGPYIDGVVWTLVVEAIYYAATALVIAWSTTRGGFGKWMNWLAIALIVWSGAFNVFRLLLFFVSPSLYEWTDWFFFTVALLDHGVFFGLGMLLAAIMFEGANRKLIAVAAVTLVPCLVQIGLQAGTLPDVLIASSVWLAMMALTVTAIAYRKAFVPARSRTVVLGLGRISYPLYLGHYTLGTYLIPIGATYFTAPSQLLFVSLTVVLMLAWCISMGPEKWMQRAASSNLRRHLAA